MCSFKIMKFLTDPDIGYMEALTGDHFKDRPQADGYTLAAAELRAAALSDTASIERTEEVLAQLATKTRRHRDAHGPQMAEEH